MARQFRISHNDLGASAVEYALLVVAIAATILLVAFALGGYVKGDYQNTCAQFSNAGAVTTSASSGSNCSS